MSGPICYACGKPEGTGSLYDFHPEVPPQAREAGVTPEQWREFAMRYRCLACAGSVRSDR